MIRWFIRGLRGGVRTTRWPAGEATGSTDTHSLVLPSSNSLSRNRALALQAACPTGALELEARDGQQTLVLRQARCILCGACTKGDAFRFSCQVDTAQRSTAELTHTIPIEKEGKNGD